MGIKITLIGSKKGDYSTKDMVVTILSTEWPCSAKRIFYIMKKEYDPAISYHASYKAISSLLEEGVITKEAKKYKINMSWLKRAKHLLSKIEETYLGKHKMILKSDLSKITFNSLEDTEVFVSKIF